MPKILGVITARGGSKSIPKKNIKELCKKPLITWTIEAAQKSGVFDRLILSTDDKEIAAVAEKLGVEIPFLRPAELSQDKTPHLPVMQHAVKWLQDNQNYFPDYVTILQPTSPLRQSWHIKEAAQLIEKTKADSAVSVIEIPTHFNPAWALKMDEKSFVRLFVSGEPMRKRIYQRQLLPKVYIHNSAIYIFKRELLFDKNEPNFYGDKVAGYVMEEKYSANIDNLKDWAEAERNMQELGLA